MKEENAFVEQQGCSPRRRRGSLLVSQTRLSSFRRHSMAATEELVGSASHRPSVVEIGASEPSYKDAAEMFSSVATRRGRNSIVDVQQAVTELSKLDLDELEAAIVDEETPLAQTATSLPPKPARSKLVKGLQQIPAVLLVCLLNLMMAIPFGVALFPLGWSNEGDMSAAGGADAEADQVHGDFPLPGKEALGIRFFLFSTVVGQIVMTYSSRFSSAISLEMVENTPFWHALAYSVINVQGYGIDSLSTLFFLFGFSSVIVGIVFYLLGSLNLGRIVYYFPAHVLIGCVGGIGVFIAITAIEVTNNHKLEFTVDGLRAFIDNLNLFGLVLAMEAVLRFLSYLNHRTESGQPHFQLLAPVFFCLITPIFYLGMWTFDVDMDSAIEAGYFYPSSDSCSGDDACKGSTSFWDLVFDEHLFDMWRAFDFTAISWRAVFETLPTVTALTAFSLLHVPINIPSFAVSIGTDVDMDAELRAHGYSNFLSGLFGGLQNYMCYCNSVLYAKSGGEGRSSSMAIAMGGLILFFIAPQIGSYIPRCMAGVMLLHLGIDLTLEGVYDSYGQFDGLEYAGIWVIVIVMTMHGMEAALIAGIIAALSVYAVQSMTTTSPIRTIMTASSLRSSCLDRSPEALATLEDATIGRDKILVVQLQGHLFFGNVTSITDTIKEMLKDLKGAEEEPWIMILDFTLIVGMDSSAAHAIAKLKGMLLKSMHLEVVIFVTGCSDGFPCSYRLADELSKSDFVNHRDTSEADPYANDQYNMMRRGSMLGAEEAKAMRVALSARSFPRSRVCDDLDSALVCAEDFLLARAYPGFTHVDEQSNLRKFGYLEDQLVSGNGSASLDDELTLVEQGLMFLCPQARSQDVSVLVRLFKREVYIQGAVIWKQGAESVCAKILIRGRLISRVEGTDTSELITEGNFIGELGLVSGAKRLTTVECASESAILYTLEKGPWDALAEREPKVARIMDMIVIRYLSHRCQHVSNRFVETRCLPI